MSHQPIYLDYAAATPMDDAAIAAMQPYLQHNFHNPSAAYQPAREVRKALEEARANVASVIGAKDQEVIFTAGGTEANNIAIHSVMRQFPEGNIVVSAIEHDSVLAPAGQYDCRVAPVNERGIIDLNALEALIDEHTVLVSVMYANNEVGTIQPIKEVASLLAEMRQKRTNGIPLYLHSDACQAANYLDLQVQRLGVDMLTLNGGKIYAAKQSGVLYVQKDVSLASYTQGGGQEKGIRSGTENVANCVAFATMLQKVQSDRKMEVIRIQALTENLFAKMSQKIPTITRNGDVKKRLPNNLNITVEGADGERLLMELEQAGLLVATGSACSASSEEPSHVLLAMGLSADQASASLRLTLGRFTTEESVQEAADILTKTIQSHQRLV